MLIRKIAKNLFYLLSVYFVILMTLLYPMPEFISTVSYQEDNYIPFAVISNIIETKTFGVSIYNILGNIVLFVPFGLLLPLKYKTINTFVKCLLVGCTFSVGVEICQLILPLRQTDIDDVILNTLGTGIGYCLYKIIVNIKSQVEQTVR